MKNSWKNPWTEISDTSDYVLKDDRPYLKAFNKMNKEGLDELKRRTKEDKKKAEEIEKKKINFQYPPEPRLGPIDAPVVLLQSNPSFDVKEANGPAYEDLQKSLESLRDENLPHKGALEETGWWAPRLRDLIAGIGGSEDDARTHLAENLLTVEYFPYRARKFDHGHIRLPSQSYTFALVKRAIENDAVIIVSRSWRLWCAAVPGLYDLNNKSVFDINSPRSTYYSRKNIGHLGYAAIMNKLNGD